MPRVQHYLAQTQPGFEVIAAQEIEARLDDAVVQGIRTIGDKNGMVLFDYAGDVRDLFTLRTVEDIFAVIFSANDLPFQREALRQIEALTVQARTVEAALSLAKIIQPGRGGRGKTNFRVIARQEVQAAYRRVDAQRAVERGITLRGDRQWRFNEEGEIEFWLTLLPGEAWLALRLSDERMRHREYKSEHLPASLRPTAAASLAWLTDPRDDDVFLDPMCGAGTVLIERAQMGRYQQLLGGDIREDALAVARANVGPRYKPIELRQWDARRLPLDAGSVSAVAVNLPFGKQIGTPENNRILYPAFLREMVRVMRPQARLVALTSDARTFMAAMEQVSGLARRATYSVKILGLTARIYLLERQ